MAGKFDEEFNLTVWCSVVKLISVNVNFLDTLKKQATEILLGSYICALLLYNYRSSLLTVTAYGPVVLSSFLWQNNVSPCGFAYKRHPNYALVNVTILHSSAGISAGGVWRKQSSSDLLNCRQIFPPYGNKSFI